MALLLRKKDRIDVEIAELKFKLAPLSFDAKMKMNDAISGAKENDINASMKASKIAMAYSVKDIKGIECLDGSEYELEFDGEALSDDCIDELMNLEHAPKLMAVSMQLLIDISKDIIDPATGEKMEGVEIILPGKKADK